MDVRCERCGTHYEFSESRITDEGLAVKCSSCAHIFHVHRNAGLSTTGGGQWMLRQGGGSVFHFKELTTLQRWIVERKVFRDDEISKTGKNWKRLGNIAELTTFFQVLEGPAATAADPPAPTAMPQPAVQQSVPVPTTSPSRRDTGDGWRMESTGVISNSAHEDDDDDLFPPKGGKGKWVAAVLLLLIAGGGGGFYYYKPDLIESWLAPKIPELAISHVDTGYEKLQKDSFAAIDSAIDDFERAVFLSDKYARAKAALAEAELFRGEYLLEESKDLEKALAAADDEQKAELEKAMTSKRGEGEAAIERAFTSGSDALLLDGASLTPSRAMADYYRLKGSQEKMKPLLEAARRAAPGDPGVAYILGSAAAGDPAKAERAIRYFDQALEGAPAMNRARYKLARVYAGQDSKEKALLHVRTILQATPEHERSKALKLELEPPPEPKKKPERKAMTFMDLMRQADRLREADQSQRALRLYERAVDMEEEDPDGHTGMGWVYLDLEEPASAINSFKQALSLVPRFSDAHFGLAEAYRMRSMKRDAVKHYQKYLDIMPDGDEASIARRMIQTLNK